MAVAAGDAQDSESQPRPASVRFATTSARDFSNCRASSTKFLPPDMPGHKRHQIGLSIMGQCTLYRGLGKILPLVIDSDEWPSITTSTGLPSTSAQLSLAALGLAPPLAGPAQKESGKRRRSSNSSSSGRYGPGSFSDRRYGGPVEFSDRRYGPGSFSDRRHGPGSFSDRRYGGPGSLSDRRYGGPG